MEDLEKKIKKINREIKFTKCKDKILFPFRKLKETNQNLCEIVKEYIEKSKESRRQNILEKERERLFQNECQKRYQEYINSYNPDRVGDREYFETKNDFNEAIRNYKPCQTDKITYFTELGNIIKTHHVYPSVYYGKAIQKIPFNKTEYEGFAKDENGKFIYAIETLEQDSFTGPVFVSTIERKPNGKFVKRDGRYYSLKQEFEKCEQEYRDAHQTNQM